ncbi:MAG: methyltransferase domain-containing protein, partial [Nitrospirae bacterium]|nr:methyltransferase domain-containing protein [Nitrospirota bacterium]
SFGGVFIIFTLCFAEDPEKIIREAGRVLKHGGGLIAGIINRESSWGEFYMKKKAGGHHIYKYARFYSVGEAAGMIERAGLSVEAYSSTLCLPPVESPVREKAVNGFADGAGFVCILAGKL